MTSGREVEIEDGILRATVIEPPTAVPERGGLVPAVALTAYAGQYGQPPTLKVRFRRHVTKLLEPEAQVWAIADWIGNR